MPNYINQSEAAKIYCCTRPAVRAAMNPGKALFLAVVKVDGHRMIDLDAEAAKNWRQSKRIAPQSPDAPEVVTAAGGREGVELEAKVRKYWDWTLRDILLKFGTMPMFSDLLKAADKIESIHARQLDSDRRTGELISREFVKKHILSLIERVFQRMLAEMPVSLATEVHTMCATGATVEEVQQAIHDAVSQEIKTIKKDARKEIKRAKD